MNAKDLTTVLPTEKEVSQRAARELLSAIEQAQRTFGAASVVLTGGTIGIQVLRDVRMFAENGFTEADFSKVEFWFGDERFVARDSDERNEKQAREALLDHVGVPEERIHAMGAAGEFETVEDAAEAYARDLTAHAAADSTLPRFDVLLLGMGPDGHIASLFPGTGLIEAQGLTTPVRNSPKPPPERVSLTRSTISSAREVWLVVTGEGKAAPVAAAFAGEPADVVPSGAVAGVESTRWFLDEAAHAKAAERGV